MDTRKLSLEESAHEHEMELQDEHGQRLGAVWLESPDTATGEEMAFGVELVRRWNAFPELVAKLEELELRLTQARIASTIGRPKLKDADFLRGEMERIGQSARELLNNLKA